jgi:Kef-type K+ transport system membrane component KefB
MTVYDVCIRARLFVFVRKLLVCVFVNVCVIMCVFVCTCVGVCERKRVRSGSASSGAADLVDVFINHSLERSPRLWFLLLPTLSQILFSPLAIVYLPFAMFRHLPYFIGSEHEACFRHGRHHAVRRDALL